MNKYCIIAATPFQLLNILNFTIFNISRPASIDLFISKSGIMSDLSKRIITTKIFDNVYTYTLKQKSTSFNYYLYDLKQAILPLYFLKEVIDSPIVLKPKDYDFITITSGHDIEMALVRCFPRAKQIAIDDGLGSYIGDIIHDHKLNVIWKIFGRNMKKINPQILYVNNSKVCQSTLCTDIRSLKNLNSCDEKFKTLLKKIFVITECDLYKDTKIIFLTQPMNEITTSEYIENDVKNIIKLLSKKYSNKFLLRIHPRDKFFYDCEYIDTNNFLWELLCLKEIDDCHTLISICSSAQISPKIFFDKEPNVIFLYEMFRNKLKKDVYERFNKIHKLLLDAYDNKGRIYTPSNEYDLHEILFKLL